MASEFFTRKPFVAYGGPLFAQDEIQVAEHPVLACLKESLMSSLGDGFHFLTVENEKPTLFLSQMLNEDALSILTLIPQGRPSGLYGNNFSQASEDAIRNAINILNPPTISNIIAMESPPPKIGSYTKNQIEFILGQHLLDLGQRFKNHKLSILMPKYPSILGTGVAVLMEEIVS